MQQFQGFLSNVLHECAVSGDFLTGKLVHAYLEKLGVNGVVSLWNKLLGLYCRCGQLELAHRLFVTMPMRDVISYNTMISTLVQNSHCLDALCLYSKMKEKQIKPSHITLARLVSACDGSTGLCLHEALHAQAIQYGLSSDVFFGSSLVDGYAKQMRLEDAIGAFGEIAELDLVAWNIMIDACARNNSREHALTMFSKMLKQNVGFDGFTLTSILKTCSQVKDLDYGMQLHCYSIKYGLFDETPINNSLITMYSKCEKGMKSAIKIFEGILAPNIISWTAIIAGFMQNGQNGEAIELYKDMLRLGMKENDFSFASVLPAYSSLADLEQGRQMHARIIKSWFSLDLSVNNALMDMYSKCGSIEDAHVVFLTMGKHDVVSCTTMITGFGQHGKGRDALEIFQEMSSEGLDPDDVTFLGCLSACSHCGLVDEGIWIFRMMTDVHNLNPKKEHFACVVDMLGRAGRLNEAEKFIVEVGLEFNILAWEALLGTCRLHGELVLGERSAKKILELQPARHGTYVMLANMYADRGLWEDKWLEREKLTLRGLKTEVGCSWVAL